MEGKNETEGEEDCKDGRKDENKGGHLHRSTIEFCGENDVRCVNGEINK
jgi:hypothetical protein